MPTSTAAPVVVAGREIAAGRRERFEIPVARMFTDSWLSLPVTVLHGRRPGPRVWLSAAIHGDELNGMAIIRRILRLLDVRTLRGTVVAVPVVNIFGFVQQSRYLPDRRDLNRSFPGSPRGSLASRLAHLFLKEIVEGCDLGIDLHTGGFHRTNWPQIRAHLEDPETRRLALAFGAPLVFEAPLIKGSLRAVVRNLDVPYLLYEAGEPLRFSAAAIDTGVLGVRRVLAAMEMAPDPEEPVAAPREARATRWVRAHRSGIFEIEVRLGEKVENGGVLGWISDLLMRRRTAVRAPKESLVIGFTNNPLVHQGDALVHLAEEVGLAAEKSPPAPGWSENPP